MPLRMVLTTVASCTVIFGPLMCGAGPGFGVRMVSAAEVARRRSEHERNATRKNLDSFHIDSLDFRYLVGFVRRPMNRMLPAFVSRIKNRKG